MMQETPKKAKVNLKQLVITLAIGAIPVIVFFLWSGVVSSPTAMNVLWWLGSVSLLVTLFAACFSFNSKIHVPVFTLFVVFALTWVLGSVFQTRLAMTDINPQWRNLMAWLLAFLVSIGAVFAVWFLVFFVSTKWILSISDSLGVSWWTAFNFLVARTFDTSQYYLIIENGEIAVDNSKGLLAKFGGPGVLVVRPGNVVVLERGGRTSRIVGPGVHALKYLETIKKPETVKGIIDLRPQFVVQTVENVLTHDGIPLKFEVSSSYVIEPKSATDQRLAANYLPPDDSPVLGEPEYPVYESTIRKAVFATTAGGWKGLFPGGPISRFRDVVGTYTLDQIFVPNPRGLANPDERVLRKMEEEVGRQFVPAWAGVKYNGFDILQVSVDPEIRERLMKRWTQPVDLTLMMHEARQKAEAIAVESEGRARALERMEEARAKAWEMASNMMLELMRAMEKAGHAKQAWDFVNIVRQLTVWAGHDDTVAMNYIEAMQRIVESDGSKHIFLQPTGFVTNPLIEPPAREKPAPSELKMVSGGHTINGEPLIQEPDDQG